MTSAHERPMRPRVPKYEVAPRPAPTGLVGRLWGYFARTAWTREHASAKGLAGAYWRAVRVVYLATSGFLSDQCLFRASALTYSTVLSLVPLLALTFAVAKGFGFYASLLTETINPLLDETFGSVKLDGPMIFDEKAHAVRVAIAQVLEFVDHTNVSALGWFGLGLLVFTAIKLLSSIEGTFNEIWGVQRSRSWVRKLTDYLAMLVVTPILLFVATGLTAAAKSSDVFRWLHDVQHFGWVLDGVLRLAPIACLWIGFTFVYLAMPNARTKLSSALIGALVGGTLWQGTLLVHLEFQIGIARYNAIYSGFAVLPVFLMWVQFSWMAVLIGAEVCNAHQSEPTCSFPDDVREEEQAFREAVALRSLGRIGEAFLAGEAPWTAERLAQDLALARKPVMDVLGRLVEGRILVVAVHAGETCYLPARDLAHITVKSAIDSLRGASGFEGRMSKASIDAGIDRVLEGLDREITDSRHNRTLHALAESALRARGEGSREATGESVPSAVSPPARA